MKTRAITGFFFIIVMLASMLLGQYVFGVFYLLLSALALREFYGLIKQSGIKPNQTVGIVNGVLIFIAFSLNQDMLPATFKYVFILALTLSLIFFQELYKK